VGIGEEWQLVFHMNVLNQWRMYKENLGHRVLKKFTDCMQV